MKLPPKPNKIEKGQLWASSDLKNVWLTCEKRGSDRVYMSLVNCAARAANTLSKYVP